MVQCHLSHTQQGLIHLFPFPMLVGSVSALCLFMGCSYHSIMMLGRSNQLFSIMRPGSDTFAPASRVTCVMLAVCWPFVVASYIVCACVVQRLASVPEKQLVASKVQLDVTV